MTKAITIILLAITLYSCGNGNAPKNEKKAEKPAFSLPEIPQDIKLPEKRQEYLARHYWDNLNPADTTLLTPEFIESNFVNWVTVLSFGDKQTATRCIKEFMQRMEHHPRWRQALLQTADKYLYDAASPMLNEEMYIPFAQSALFATGISEADFVKYTHRLEVAQKNRPGTKAANFDYTTAKGRKSTLHTTTGALILLVFHDPECDNCKGIMQLLRNDATLQRLTRDKQLTVLLIYTEGDKAIWEQYKNSYPQEWLSGFDSGEKIKMERIYELRAMPSMYLLDENKNVLLKDALPEAIIAFLNTHEQQPR